MMPENFPNVASRSTLDLSLWLDDYDDIYSDFDSRNYSKRRVSADFIDELSISLKNKHETINDLVLLLPEEKRDRDTEQKIMISLRGYFSSQLSSYSEKFNKELKKGIILFIIALFLMVMNTVIGSILSNELVSSIIRIVLEPCGWFLIWISFDILYYDLREFKKEKHFFRELSNMKIYFQSSDVYESNIHHDR